MATRILGIDPGLTRCGVGFIELEAARRVNLLEVQTLTSSKDENLSNRIGAIADQLIVLMDTHKPATIAIERVFAQQNLSTVMGTAQISGVVFHLAYQRGIPVSFYTPTEVKAAVSGSGRAGKQQVGEMVTRILGLSEVPKPADSADALAIAICHAWKGAGLQTGFSSPTAAQQTWQTAIRANSSAKRR